MPSIWPRRKEGDLMADKIALYCRVSTQEQAREGYSIEEQVERLTKYAESQGWLNYEVYVDPGFSGASMNRPALQKLIADVENGRIKKVVVYKLDRLSRSQKYTLELIEDIFLPHGCDFESMSEKFDTGTPFGNAMIGILAVFAQLERETIKERMSLGKEGRAKNGLWRGGNGIPVGYDYIDGQLRINESEAIQIREAFDLYLKGYGAEKIARILDAKGYSHKYGSWNAIRVKSILVNPLYIGKLQHGGSVYEGQHEPIVSDEIFQKAQELCERKSYSKSKKDSRALLGGLCFCKKCGARYFRWKARKIYKYSCYSRRNVSSYMKRAETCDNKHWNASELEGIVLDQIRQLSLDPDKIKKVSHDPDLEDRTAALYEMVEKIENQRSRLLDLYTLGSFTMDELSEKMEGLNSRLNSLKNEIEIEKTKNKTLKLSEVQKITKSLENLDAEGDSEELRNLVHLLIDYIEIDGEDVFIHWNF